MLTHAAAMTTLAEIGLIAGRVLGGGHPTTEEIEGDVERSRARSAPARRLTSDKASNPMKGLVHYLGRLDKARWRGNARKIAKFGRKVQKYNRLAAAAVETS